jgi:hypothetical protein
LSATISQYFIGGMTPELLNPVQQDQTIIEIRLSSVFRFCLGADQRLKNRRHEKESLFHGQCRI